MTTRTLKLLAAPVCALCLASPASAASTRLTIRGAGFGHGVGMSQWGAYGYATHGATYRDILAHYYTGTEIGAAGSRTVRVLLMGGVSRAHFTGATAAGDKLLDPGRTYGVRAGRLAGTVDLLSPTGRRMRTVAAPLRVTGPGTVTLAGKGTYRGALEFSPSGIGGVQAVNAVALESYVRGVVSRESPSSWPIEALKAQAVAARTYAITTSRGAAFDQYDDTRSQVYGGVAAETPASDEAVAETAGEVVTYQGQPVVTYFFSTSGGRTEDVENTSLGTEPLPWLRSVDDPYDNSSPRHRWGPYRMTLRQASSKLRGLIQGRLRGIRVVERGASPRIMKADVVGSRGTTRVDGATLRARFGLFDTWMYFTTITTGTTKPVPPSATAPTGGASPDPESRAARRMARRLTGEVLPAPRGSLVTVQMRQRHGWATVGSAQTDSRGRYAFSVARPGVYRVRFLLDAGPAVRIR